MSRDVATDAPCSCMSLSNAAPPANATPAVTMAIAQTDTARAPNAMRAPIPFTKRGRGSRCHARSRRSAAVGGVSEPLAQAPYVDIDRAIDRFAIRGSVERVEERVSREHATFGFDERDEQAEFERGKRQALTAAEHLVPLAVDDEVAEPQRLAR